MGRNDENAHSLSNVSFCSWLPPVSPPRAEDAGLKQTEIKILPWETRIEKMAILSHVSRKHACNLCAARLDYLSKLSVSHKLEERHQMLCDT